MHALFGRLLTLPRERLSRLDVDHRRILRGLVLVAGFVMIGKVIAAGKEMIIAYRFGLSGTVDAYLIALTFAMWIPGIWASVLNTVFVPLVHRLDDAERRRFVGELTGATLLAAGLLTPLLYVTLPLLLASGTVDLSPEAALALERAVRGMAPLAGIGLLVAQLSVQLLAEERHANTLLDASMPLVLGLTVLLWPSADSVDPLVWGTLLGLGLQLGGLVCLLLSGGRVRARPILGLSSPAWRSFRTGIGVMVAGNLVMSFVEPISTLIAAGLGEGSVAGLGYANRVLALFLTLGAMSVGRAILPVLSNSEKSEGERIDLALHWVRVMLLGGAVAAALAWLLAPLIVRLLFERGEFGAKDSAAVARAVGFGVLQFPVYFAGIVLVQLCASLQLYRVIFMSSVIALSVKALCSYSLAQIYGFAGIALANVPMYLATATYFALVVRRLRRRRQRADAAETVDGGVRAGKPSSSDDGRGLAK